MTRAFHKGSRGNATDITFPDIKVGDMVNARGAVQGGNFLATNLTVMEPGQRGQGEHGQGERGQGRFGGAPQGNQSAPQAAPGAPANPVSQSPQSQGTPAGSAPPQQPNQQQN